MKFPAWMTGGGDGTFYIRSAYSFLVASSTEALEHIIIVFVVYLLVCLLSYKLIFSRSKRFPIRLLSDVRFPDYRRVLFVISHPDDECMFFGPTIRSLTKREDCQVNILCLSKGNYEKQGKLRRDELWKSCSTLGIPQSNITLVNATHLPDDPNVEWKVETIAKIISKAVESLDIQAVITFDRDGVSQHPNHCAVYYATASLCLAGLMPKGCKIYTLDTINIIRKYISLFDLVCTFMMSTNWCIISLKEAKVVRAAMQQHVSQMRWFRRLYIIFSRYMFINSLREINLSDIELEMQIQDS
ncbi:N-acetylglucosaminyl-phosphatidylinositol de-N-acetylase [Hermetia illucens]|uniref:N-acetylglucosaminyl-phosphatidylinositol de-N-acetylase n=1 Tax=Hermetia illucens TaxID=343691 RepID=UPI0018CC7A36|nr:N-acetylglucosaminyl-phosphatidylinositol de-N-acetylase [Hermetia illucens]